MKYFKKKLSFKMLVIVLLSFLLFSGCKDNKIQNGISYDGTIQKTNFDTYCAKEKSAENRVYFNYPQFRETVNTEELNILIVEFVESSLQKVCSGGFNGNLRDSTEYWNWNNDEYTNQAMNISYEIKRSDSDYFSVTFKGLYNNKTAAQPVDYFNSFIIDIKKCELVTLSDLYNINTDYVELVNKNFKNQIRTGLAERLGVSINEIPESVEELLSSRNSNTLMEGLRNTDKDSTNGFHSFLTDETLGISVPLENALGDHFEIMIDYDQLEPFKN